MVRRDAIDFRILCQRPDAGTVDEHPSLEMGESVSSPNNSIEPERPNAKPAKGMAESEHEKNGNLRVVA